MTEEVHYILVGFDFERLIQPFNQDDFDADRIVLIYSEPTSEQDKEGRFGRRIARDLRDQAESVLDIEVEMEPISELFDYPRLYQTAYHAIESEISDGNRVFINISSTPRTVAFAFVAAANTHITNHPEYRDDIYVYYVSAENYMITEILEELDKEIEFLSGLEDDVDTESSQEDRLDRLIELYQTLKRGTTKGARKLPNGDHHIRFAAPPVADIDESNGLVLKILDYMGEAESISSLARTHADYENAECDSSYKSTIQYKVDKLEEKGYIERDETGKSHSLKLTTTGEMWTSTQSSISESEFD